MPIIDNMDIDDAYNLMVSTIQITLNAHTPAGKIHTKPFLQTNLKSKILYSKNVLVNQKKVRCIEIVLLPKNTQPTEIILLQSDSVKVRVRSRSRRTKRENNFSAPQH